MNISILHILCIKSLPTKCGITQARFHFKNRFHAVGAEISPLDKLCYWTTQWILIRLIFSEFLCVKILVLILKGLQSMTLAEGSLLCQIVLGQYLRFVICDWLDLICHMYPCPFFEHRGWGLPLVCLCRRVKKNYLH